MKKTACIIAVFSIVTNTLLYGQSVTHPWHTLDNGGGGSVSGQMSLQSSVGQPAGTEMSANGTILESGFIPGLRIISGTSSTLDVAIESGWNMISVPFVVSDFRKSVLYPTGNTKAYNYHSGYSTYDTLKNGLGYWIKFAGAGMSHFTGATIVRDTIILHDGWNMIGCISHPLPISVLQQLDSTTITTPYWSYKSGLGYSTVDTIMPGKGYWIKVKNSGRFVLKSGSTMSDQLASGTKKSPGQLREADMASELNTLTIRDASGRERRVFFAPKAPNIDPEKWEMPPVPFEGIMDVRFSSNRMLESDVEAKAKDVDLRISSAEYPLTISWKIAREMKGAKLVIGQNEVQVSVSGEARINSNTSRITLSFAPAVEAELPKSFALHQNYPNPFNPSTTIRYDLPMKSYVSLKLYNLLGEEVKTLVEGVEDAGFRSIVWNASGDASGVYFYRLEARAEGGGQLLVEVKKLVLVK